VGAVHIFIHIHIFILSIFIDIIDIHIRIFILSTSVFLFYFIHIRIFILSTSVFLFYPYFYFIHIRNIILFTSVFLFYPHPYFYFIHIHIHRYPPHYFLVTYTHVKVGNSFLTKDKKSFFTACAYGVCVSCFIFSSLIEVPQTLCVCVS